MNDMIAWLRGVLDNRRLRAEGAVRDRYRDGRMDSPWQVRPIDDDTARATLVADGIEYAGGDSDVIEYLAARDPRSELARIEAELAVIDEIARIEQQEDEGNARDVITRAMEEDGRLLEGLDFAAQWIAYGHRFDAAGYDPSWAPEGMAT